MTASEDLDVQAIRDRFPSLARLHGGRPVAYFDGPGGTQVPLEVVEAVTDYLVHHNANAHWPFPTSRETDEVVASGRGAVADLLGAASEEVVFGPNMTTLAFHLARALGRTMDPGDEILVTELDHHANVDPWRDLAVERGVEVRAVRMDPEGCTLDWEDLEAKLGPKTRLLAIGAASNAVGTVTDVARAAGMAHTAGALVFVDAVHYTPHRKVEVEDLGCDFLACSPYKFYGPHLGVLWGRRERFEELHVSKLQPAPDRVPERLETGTALHEGIAGAAATVDFIASLGRGENRVDRLEDAYGRLHTRGERLIVRLVGGLEQIDGVTVHGPGTDHPRTPTAAFAVGAWPSEEVSARLAEGGVFTTCGDFYASTLVERLGRADSGLVRAGCACYTTEEEVDRLLEGVADLARQTV
ncbi:MAG: cysteine desulfurase-like protein [bacterium]